MKNTELRIGNYVRESAFLESKDYKNYAKGCMNPYHEWTMKRVQQIESDKSGKVIGVNHYKYKFEARVEGIPITEEWLDKFDFRVKHSDSERSSYLIWRLKVAFLKFNLRCVVHTCTHGSSTYLRELKCVHEVQNLIFAITGKELDLKKEVADGLS